jgi:ATP synthase protein I
MAQQRPPSARTAENSQGDAWHAFGALVSGVLVYGLIGWVLDRWLDTSFLVVVGIVLGAVLGLYMTWARFRPPREGSADKTDLT